MSFSLSISNDNIFIGVEKRELKCSVNVVVIEEALGFDPFTISKEAYYPVTFGDFVRFYEDAANSLELAAGGTR